MIKRHSVLARWIVSYLIILCVPVLINGITFRRVNNLLESETVRANQQILNQVRDNLDNEMIDINKALQKLAVSEDINMLARNQSNMTAQQAYQMVQIINRDLSSAISTSDLVQEAYVYFPLANIALTSRAKYDASTAYEVLVNDSAMPYSRWYEQMHAKHYYDQYILAKQGTQDGQILNVLSIPVNNQSVLANLVISLNTSRLFNLFKNMPWTSESLFMIANSKGEIIYADEAVANEVARIQSQVQASDSTRLSYISLNKRQYVMMNTESKISGWQFTFLIPIDYFWHQSRAAYLLNVWGITLCLLIGLIMTFILLRRNYKPLRNILDQLKKNGIVKDDGTYNEYLMINASLAHMLENNHALTSRIEEQEDFETSYSLAGLLKNNYMEDFFESDSGKRLKTEARFALMAIVLDRAYESEQIFALQQHKNSEQYHTMRRETQQKIKDTDLVTHYYIEIDERLVVWFRFAQKMTDEQCRNEMGSFAQSVLSTTAAQLERRPYLICSGIYERLELTAQMYQEINEAIEAGITEGEEHIRYTDSLPKYHPRAFEYSMAGEQKLITLLKTGQAEEAKKLVNTFVKTNLAIENQSPQMLKMFEGMITGSFVRAIHEMGRSTEQYLLEELQLFDTNTEICTLRELETYLYGIIDQISSALNTENTAAHYDVVCESKKYIVNNYMDENLNISTLAEHFGMNANYFSRLFRDSQKCGILDYINNVRLKEAKQLMNETTLGLNEIAKKCGYYNSLALTRAFKKYEGITPGRWKDRIHSSVN